MANENIEQVEQNDETTAYNVHLILPVDAATPGEAVKKFIDTINLHGLKTWVYSVANDEEPEPVVYVNGFGSPVNPSMDGESMDGEDEE